MLLNPTLVFFIFLFVFAWLAGITFFGGRFFNSFKKLTEGVSEKDIKTLLEEILKKADLAQKENQKIRDELATLEKEKIFHLQKVGLLRYNPFADTGGDQSFVLALLDGKDDGIVITSLHSREQTRVFTKPVEKGKESGYEFSKEEIEAIIRAKKGKMK